MLYILKNKLDFINDMKISIFIKYGFKKIKKKK